MSDRDSSPTTLVELLQALHKQTEDDDGDIAIGDIVAAFSGRAFGPLLALPGFAIVSPLGMAPSLPTLMGAIVVLVAGQRVAGRTQPWLPNVLSERCVRGERVRKATDRFLPWAKRIDHWTSSRLRFLVEGPMKRGLAAVAIVAAATLPPLELAPGAAYLPGAAILMLGLAIMADDGALAAVAVLLTVAGGGAVVYAVL